MLVTNEGGLIEFQDKGTWGADVTSIKLSSSTVGNIVKIEREQSGSEMMIAYARPGKEIIFDLWDCLIMSNGELGPCYLERVG